MSVRSCRRWFAKFRIGDFYVSNKERSGRPSDVDDLIRKAFTIIAYINCQDVEIENNGNFV